MNEQQRYQELYQSLLINNKLMYAGHILERAAELFGSKCAIVSSTMRLNFRDLFAAALLVSRHLIKKGVKQGDKIMITYENSPMYYIAYYGIWQIGAVVVPVNNLLHANELEHIIANAAPHGLVISTLMHKTFSSVIGSIPLIITEEQLDNIILEEAIPTQLVHTYLHAQEPNALSVLLYTSGTTGMPKGVMLSSRNILTNMLQGAARFNSDPQDSVLVSLPLFHSYSQNTCLWMPALLGVTVIVIKKIDRTSLLEGLSYKPTIIVGIPQLYGLFCLMRTAPFDNVRFFMCGGDALPDRIRMGFELIYHRKLCNGYGLTETSPFISADLDDVFRPTDSVGTPVINLRAELRDDDIIVATDTVGARTAGTNVVDNNAVGVLWVKGPNIMLGYYNNQAMTDEMINDGWLNTGDLARFDHHGKIVLAGRQKDLIKYKGMKIYPTEIENVLMKHSSVLAVGVIGRAYEHEEIPIAYIASRSATTDEEKQILEKELRALCTEHLAAYEIPKVFIIKRELPTTATGKVSKKVLKAQDRVTVSND